MDEALIRTRLDEALAETEPDFGRFFLLRFFGFEVHYGNDTCTVRIPTSSYMNNPQGSLHGGVIAMAADISMGHLCNHALSTAVTLEMDLKFIRPVAGPARAEARFLKKVRTVVNLESRVVR
jgi:acyl-CoA thioesterase